MDTDAHTFMSFLMHLHVAESIESAGANVARELLQLCMRQLVPFAE